MPVFRRSSAGASEAQAEESSATQTPGSPGQEQASRPGGQGLAHAQAQCRPRAAGTGSITGSTTSGRGPPGVRPPGQDHARGQGQGAATNATSGCTPCGAARSGRSARATAARSRSSPGTTWTPPAADGVLHVRAGPAAHRAVRGQSQHRAQHLHAVRPVVLVAVVVVDAYCCAGRSSSWRHERLPDESPAAWRCTPSCARCSCAASAPRPAPQARRQSPRATPRPAGCRAYAGAGRVVWWRPGDVMRSLSSWRPERAG